MQPPGFLSAACVVVLGALVINFFIRVAASDDAHSVGLITDFLRTHSAFVTTLWFIGASAAVQTLFWVYGLVRSLFMPGVVDFWRVVARNPDAAYQWFIEANAWRVRDYPLPPNHEEEFPTAQWAGPFDLYVPSIARRVCIFGRTGEYEKSRESFVQMVTCRNQQA